MQQAPAWPEVRLGEPVTSGPLTLYPVVDGLEAHTPDYVLLAAAIERGTVQVTEVSDSGSVPVLLLENRGELPVLLVQGEELQGAKQNRTLNVTVLIGPGKTEIPVTCVEQGRWRRTSPEFRPGEFESIALRKFKTASVSSSRRRWKGRPASSCERYAADQGRVWKDISDLAASFGAKSPTGALSDVYDSGRAQERLRALRELELPSGTRGLVTIDSGGVEMAEIFESADVFERMWPRIRRSYALGVLGTKGSEPPRVEEVEELVNLPSHEDGEAEDSIGLGRDIRWDGDRHTAAALTWRGRLIHGVVFPRRRSVEPSSP